MSRSRPTFTERLRSPVDAVIEPAPPGMVRLYRVEHAFMRRGPFVHPPSLDNINIREQRDVDGRLLVSAWKDPARVVAAFTDKQSVLLDVFDHRLRIFEVYESDYVQSREQGVVLFPRSIFRPVKTFSAFGGRRAIERELTELAAAAAALTGEAA